MRFIYEKEKLTAILKIIKQNKTKQNKTNKIICNSLAYFNELAFDRPLTTNTTAILKIRNYFFYSVRAMAI